MEASVDVRTSMAIGKGAVVATDLSGLLDEKGVPLPLDKGDHLAVIAKAAPCCGHGASRAVEPISMALFETSEHMLISYGLKLQFDGSTQAGQSALLTLQQGFQLNYGQIIALGGDFYGDWQRPISDQPTEAARVDQFRRNYLSLVGAPQEVTAILQVAKKFEFDPLATAIRQGRNPSSVFVFNSNQNSKGVLTDVDRAYDTATGGVDYGKNGRYLNIAFTNWDHFGTDAIASYLAGHTLAQQMAVAARSMQDRNARNLQLQGAYAANAFADHFLTDLFSAGHMRTPRKPLFQIADWYETQVMAGLLAQRMHDEENKFGIWVENGAGDRWVAYGDKRYRDRVNAANRVMVKRAVQQSMDEVYDAFQSGQVRTSNSQVLNLLPRIIWEIQREPDASRHRDDRRNWAPLFWRNPSDGNVWRRESLFNPGDRRFGEYSAINPLKWGISSTFAQIKGHGEPPWMPDAEYRNAGLPLHPDEAGPSGEFGWPAEPSNVSGGMRMRGATGPHLRQLTSADWVVDGAPGPTAHLNPGGEPIISAG